MARLRSLPKRFMLEMESGAVEVTQIGKGRFTKAYRAVENPEIVYLQVDSDNDSSKELLGRIDGKHIPQLEQLEDLNGKNLYQTRFYFPLTAKSGNAWKQFRRLAVLMEQTWKETMPGYNQKRDYRRTVEHFKGLMEDDESLPESLREDLASIITWAGSYGRNGYNLEFAKRNLAVDENGTLILIDPVYDPAYIEDQNKKARDRNTYSRYVA